MFWATKHLDVKDSNNTALLPVPSERFVPVLARLFSFRLPFLPVYLIRLKFPECNVHPNLGSGRQTHQPTSLSQPPPSSGGVGVLDGASCRASASPQPSIQPANVLSSCSEQGWAQTLLGERRPDGTSFGEIGSNPGVTREHSHWLEQSRAAGRAGGWRRCFFAG